MKGWAELKEAFWAALEGGPSERARHVETLAAIDPALAARLDALLDADARGDVLQQLFQSDRDPRDPHDPPARIGTYEIIGLLGAGGMGEVYRAHDPRLHRDVAIKVLPAAFANDQERLARFEREAQVLASLNHPHIAQIYGVEEAGTVPALVMELVEGPTLARLVARYADARIPLPRVLEIAWQIADGLAAAHEHGVVHRDLKPGNIALTEGGHVKILDFGIAKSVTAVAPQSGGAAGGTETGRLLGTPAYMSPEQARGLTVDRRTDIWAFGCVLYELLTGRGPFAATTPSDSLAAVLERQPDLTLVPPETPAVVRSLLRHCLEKESTRRLRDIGDARLTIEDALHPRGNEQGLLAGPGAAPVRTQTPARTRALWVLAGLGAAAIAGVAVGWFGDRDVPLTRTRRIVSSVVLPRGIRLTASDPIALSSESRFAISPDGRRLVLVAAEGPARPRLWLRELASAVFQPLAETENASFPFWSPDSQSIGFIAAGRLKTMKVYGDPVTVVDTAFRTPSWSGEGLILFTPAGRTPLYVVPASGGQRRQVTTLDEATGEVQHSYPSFLPDGRHFLYFTYGSSAGGPLDPSGVFVASLDGSTAAKRVLTGVTQARYASGHLLFVQGGTLMAQPFDTARLALSGTPFAIAEDVNLSTAGATGAAAGYSVSTNGVLAYQAELRTESRPVWFDRGGARLATLAPPADYGDVALSPDGARLAVSVIDPTRSTRDLWLYDTMGGPGQRLTVDPGDEFAPVWSPDGRRLLYSAANRGLVNLHVTDLSVPADPAVLELDTLGQGRFATDWSRDNRFLMYVGGGRAIARSDLWTAPVASPGLARPLLDSPSIETHGRIAPGGDWFVYTSNETGQLEVYVDRFPGRGAKRAVSTGGGGWPRWSRDGTEIYYVSSDNILMVAGVRATGGRLDISDPKPLFALAPRPPVRLDAYAYDVSPDGRRFVINTLVEDPASAVITLVLNWTAGPSSK